MVAKPNPVPEPDEDIIELTDIIEQGTPPVPAALAPQAEDPLLDLMHESQDKQEENDLDALLAEIGAPPLASPAVLPDQTTDSAVNPNETLDMPDMREVENLLDELDIPPQASPSTGATLAENNAGAELDELLEQLSPAPAPVAPVPAPDAPSDLDALLDDLAATPVPPVAPAASTDGQLDGAASSAPGTATEKKPTGAFIKVSASNKVRPPSAKPVGPQPPLEAAAGAKGALDGLLESTETAAPAPPQISEPPNGLDDLDAFLENIPSVPHGDDIDETLPPSPEKAAAAPAHASSPPSDQPTAFVSPAWTSTDEAPALPRQWDNLLGHAPEQSPALQASAALPPEMAQRLVHIETQLTALSAAGAALAAAGLEARIKELEEHRVALAPEGGTDAVALEAFEKRMQALESQVSAAPDANADKAAHEIRETIGEAARLVNGLEERLRTLEDKSADLPATMEARLQALSETSAGLAASGLETRIKELEEKNAAAAPAGGTDAAALEAFEKRLQALESQVSAAPDVNADKAAHELHETIGEAARLVNGLEERLRTLEDKNADLPSTMEARLQELSAASANLAASALEARIKELEEKNATAASAGGTDAAGLEAFEKRLQALESQVSAAPDANADKAAQELHATIGEAARLVNGLEERLRTLEDKSADLPATMEKRLQELSAASADLAASALEARIKEVEEKNATAAPAGGTDAAALETFEKRLQDLENQVSAVPDANAGEAMRELNATVGEAEERVNVLEKRIRAMEENALFASGATLETTDQRFNTLEETLRAFSMEQAESTGRSSVALQELQALVQNMGASFAQLATRLDTLERGSKEEMERAAAAAAARILREELSAILADEVK